MPEANPLKNQHHPMEHTPGNKGIGRPMPQTAEKKDQHQVEQGSALALPVTAKGNIEVITEPG